MATKTTTMFSLAKVRAYLEIKGVTNTGDDALLETIADGVSERVEQMISRRVVTRARVEKLDARGRDSVLLSGMPVQSITSVKTRVHLSEAFETQDVGDFELDGFTGRLYAKSGAFPSGPLTTEVTYQEGYGAQDNEAIPAGLMEAALEFVAFVYKRGKAGVIVTSTNVGGNSITIVPKLPKDIEDAIMAYKKFRGIHLG